MSTKSDSVGGIYLKVELNYDGVFFICPFTYLDGRKYVFTDHDFAGMDLGECKTYLARFMGQDCERIFYCIPNKPLESGIRLIKDDGDYAEFLEIAYGNGCEISIYIDHIGDELEGWFEDEENGSEKVSEKGSAEEKVSCVDAEEDEYKDEVLSNMNVEEEFKPDTAGFMSKDDFLNKLCEEGLKLEPGDEFYSSDSEGEGGKDNFHSVFDESLHWKKQKPILGQKFANPLQLKNMLCNYGVANGYQLCFEKNDKRRLLVKCCKGECSFRLWASWMVEERSFQIKSLKPDHSCSRNFKLGPLVTYKWIANHYTKDILHRQKLSIRKLRFEVMKKFGIQVSISQCRRAKHYALRLIEGTLVEHYARLWSYAEEIRRSNPGSTVNLDVNCMPDGKNYFTKFYVCFLAVKRGWAEACRKIISLDGCFLKGICKGELLVAMGRDANNQIFPIAWAVVCVENKENWKWFLELLVDDLDLHLGYGYSLMSDQHKGLIEAVKEVLPKAEHRQCARHIVANLKKRWSGVEYENLFWKASKAGTEAKFKEAMKELERINPKAYSFLMDKNPHSWSRAYFQPGRCCDSVENNMSESFNAIIVDARKKPIISMLEDIRLYMMERLFSMRKTGLGWAEGVCPTIKELLDLLKDKQRFWQVFPSGMNQFEIRCDGEAYEVDVEKKTCSCRIWQLNGYGCEHSTAAIAFLNKKVESFVDRLYHTSMFNKAYSHRIGAMNGSAMWPETNYIPPLPPISRRMPGRPVVKRKRDASEGGVGIRVSKKGKKVTCSLCKEGGHNKATCKLSQPPPNKLKVKRKKTLKPKKVVEDVTPNETEDLHETRVVGAYEETNKGFESTGKIKVKAMTEGSVISKVRQSERILKRKLSVNVRGVNGEGNSQEKPVNVE